MKKLLHSLFLCLGILATFSSVHAAIDCSDPLAKMFAPACQSGGTGTPSPAVAPSNDAAILTQPVVQPVVSQPLNPVSPSSLVPRAAEVTPEVEITARDTEVKSIVPAVNTGLNEKPVEIDMPTAEELIPTNYDAPAPIEEFHNASATVVSMKKSQKLPQAGPEMWYITMILSALIAWKYRNILS